MKKLNKDEFLIINPLNTETCFVANRKIDYTGTSSVDTSSENQLACAAGCF